MANDSHKNDTQSSSFRDKILRDLEEIKNQTDSEKELKSLDSSLFPTDDVVEALSTSETVLPHRVNIKLPLVMDEDSHSLVTRFPSEEDAVEATSHILSDFPSDTDNLAFQESEAVEPRNILSESAEVELDRPKLEASSDELEDLTATVALPRNSVREVIREIESSPISRAELEDTIIPTVPRKQVESRTMQTRRRHHQRKKQDGLAKRIVKVVVVTVLLLLLLTGVTGYFYLKSSLEPVNAQATEITQIEIPEGSSTKEIAKILEENRLIKNATVFTYYSKLKSFNNFQSGFYNLSQSMTVEELAKALQESGTPTAQEPIAGKVLVVEGYTIKQIAQAVTDNVHTSDKEDKTPFTAEAFLETVQNEAFINRMVATYPKLLSNLPAANSGVKYRLEGYLFPATYEYSTKTTIEELVEQMVAAMDSRLQPYYDQLAAKGLDVNQLLTVASLVEKEGSTDEDRRNIAGVFFNRLNAGMPLQSNIAILYAMDKLGEKTTLKEDATIDTNIDSPYNIYVNAGLMPGPVDSPSLSAIEASFAPNKTNYYFFVADVTTGSVYFAETGEEHNQNVEKYINSKLNN